MTLNKSLISVAAATLLAAGFAGCGSSSSTTTNTTTATDEVKAVDGYIINATATAVYFGEDNVSVALPMTSTLATTDSVDSTKNTVGAADYKMNDDTNKSLVRYFTLSNKKLGTSGTTSTPATFIDDGSTPGVYDVNDTLFATRFPGITLYAAAGSSVLTPTTSMVMQNSGGIAAFAPATMGVDVNTTLISDAETLIAAKLNVSAETIKTIDPMNAVSTYPEFALINTMLAGVISEGKLATFTTTLAAEANATASTTFTETLTKLETSGTAAGLTTNVFTAVKADIAAMGEANYISSIPSFNLDETLNNGGTAVYNTTSSTAKASVTGITLDSDDVFAMLNKGDKISSAAKSVAITFVAPDANATGTMDLLVQLSGGKDRDNNATTNSSEITIKVGNLDFSTTEAGVVTLDVNSSATTYSVGYQENNDTGVFFSSFTDANATAAVISDFITATSNTVTTLDIQTLLANVETNMTTTTFPSGAFSFTNIMGMKIALVNNGLLQKVNATTTTNRETWGMTSVTSIADPANSALSGNGNTIVNLSTADSRGTNTKLNTAPKTTIAIGGKTAKADSVQFNGYNSTSGLNVIVLNEGREGDLLDGSYNGTITYTTSDTLETNSTFSMVKASKTMDGNNSASFIDANTTALSTLSAKLSSASTNNATYTQIQLGKLTTNAARPNSNVNGGYSIATYNVIASDEFSKAETAGESNVTFVYNARPTLDTNLSAATTVVDFDGSANISTATVGSTTKSASAAGAVTLEGAISINDEKSIDNVGNGTTATSYIMGYGFGASTTAASANYSTTLAQKWEDTASGPNLSVVLANSVLGSNMTIAVTNGTNANNAVALITLNNVTSDSVDFDLTSYDNSTVTNCANMSEAYMAVRVNTYDEFDNNKTKDLYIQFTK